MFKFESQFPYEGKSIDSPSKPPEDKAIVEEETDNK